MSESIETAVETILTPLDKDMTLETLVRIANIGLSIGIILTVGGSLVTGILASGKEYMEATAEMFQGKGEGSEHFVGLFGDFAKTYSKEELDDYSVEFIHLKEAILIQGNSEYKVGLWRGKINSVDGYSIGRLEKSEK
ncbi:gas vesicle accessory protein GvpU [Paenibacillus sp. OK003]|uniref:gas vesicle accessory protein GvpU n=1 Tax=Paenibacillus sp. OK003 TaxID=1884380 RepID=UPI0008C9ACD3|nr:gas vesicle accessory protein GvpU [Paenibacillus sp. OK003]SEL80964.1 hypothetical protein SAMN05518856_11912 [Paenibacillus sp. OK003]